MNPAIPPFCNYLYEKTSIGGMRPVQIVRQDKDCHGVPGRLRAGTASFGKMPKDVTGRPASFGKMPKDVTEKPASFGKTPKDVTAEPPSFGKMPKDVTERPASFGKTPKEGTPCGGRQQQGAQFLRPTCGADLLQRRKMRIIAETRLR